MPKQLNTQITGTVGDVIFYKWRDRYCMRSKGKTGTQAPIAKKNGSHFGKASALSARMRKLMAPLLAEPKSRRLMYRLNRIVYDLLRQDFFETNEPVNSIPELAGMSLFEQDPISLSLTGYLGVTRNTDHSLSLKIPACNPAYMSMNSEHPFLHIGLMTLSISLGDLSQVEINEQSFSLPYGDNLFPERELTLKGRCQPGCITVVVASMSYLNHEQQLVKDAGWRFGGIVGSFWN